MYIMMKFCLIPALCIAGVGLARADQSAPMPSGSFAVTHVRVFDGERTLPGQTVLVRDGRIVSVGKNAAVPEGIPKVDGAGRTLLPGLIDAHVHAFPTNALREAEALGVTTVLDMFNRPDLVKQDKAAEASGNGLNGADIYSSGILATAPGGHGTEYGWKIPTLTNAAQAQAFVDDRIAEGSDYIKIILEDGSTYGMKTPTLDRSTAAALVAAAHKRHKLAVFHIGSYADAREVAEIGGDGLMHLFVDRMPGPDFGQFIAARHVFVVPTLSVLISVAGPNEEGESLAQDPRMADYLPPEDLKNLRESFPHNGHPMHYEATTESIRQLKAAGASILAGTDAPNPGTMFGASLHGELELLVRAGLTPAEALSSATAKPADCFSLTDRGRIAPGKRADLLLVQGDPTVNITDTRNIVAVWKSGHADDRAGYAAEVASLKKAAPPGPKPVEFGDGLISNFEDGKIASAFGAGWSVSTDALYGGKSEADYKVAGGGAKGTGHALQITGEIVAGFPYPWAGAMFCPGKRIFAPANLAKSSGIQFWAKGDGKTYRLLYFTESGGRFAQIQEFVAGPEWKQYSFPFSDFAGSDGSDAEAFLFTGGPAFGKFSFQIDEVGLLPRQ